MKQHFPRRATIAALLLAAIVPATAIAHDHDQKDEHRHLREAVLSGKLLPLNRILAIAQSRAPGEVVKVELDDDDDDYRGRIIYEVKTLARSGRVMKVEIDAATGKVLKVKED
ncbi:MAG TPA: PepSY domain-containing protein [Sphingomonas sp.]|nr:PepSY domain-containing protein [Sphingomonas sp.]